MQKGKQKFQSDRLSSYFRKEILSLLIVTISGLIYNIGLTAGPYFEGQLAQTLYDIMGGRSAFTDMISLAVIYVLVILLVQGMRCLKRFYVRRFANNTSRNMRQILYNHLVHQSRKSLDEESVGTLMTKAIADVDDCVEGMRKFTTEVFDTGIALIAYLVMMFLYDWRLAILSSLFTPAAYVIAEKMKVVVYRYNSRYKKSTSALNDATMERVGGAMTYRVFGQEESRDTEYEKHLSQYEHAAVMSNIWENTLTPMYKIISMTGVIFILFFGAKNVLGTGWCVWDIAAFTAFMSCFAKMAVKSSKAAKLFNAVQKAQVSWNRIKPLMKEPEEMSQETAIDAASLVVLQVQDLVVGYDTENNLINGLSFTANPGDVIGITGSVACGKTTLGKVFLGEVPYKGSITLNGRELTDYNEIDRNHLISYLGHQPELMSDTIDHNVRFGEDRSIEPFMKLVCFDKELAEMPAGKDTEIGNGGIRLSGGQQARVALARTLYHGRKLLVLDDPFSAVDRATEQQILEQLRERLPDAVLLIFSHRITQFPEFSAVIWMEEGRTHVGTHTELMEQEKQYARIFTAQQMGGDLDEA